MLGSEADGKEGFAFALGCNVETGPAFCRMSQETRGQRSKYRCGRINTFGEGLEGFIRKWFFNCVPNQIV